MTERALHINETVVLWISVEEREALQDKLRVLTEQAKKLLGAEKYVTLISSRGQYIQIVRPHGSMGHEETEIMIEIYGSSLKDFLAKYLVFGDRVIKRPNRWVDIEVTDELGQKSRKKINPSNKPGEENYEVGVDELDELLRLISSLNYA